MEIHLREIEKVEKLEDFQDEYVYDIEVDDLHNFFANDVLVHNSIYVEYGRISNQLGFTDINQATRFVVDMWNYGCGPYMERCYEEYAKSYNCPKNLQSLELEKIADTAVMVAKKHYAMSECFLEPNIYVKPGEHVLYKGLELIQGGTAPYARQCHDHFYRFILDWYAHHTTPPEYGTLVNMVREYKKDFMLQEPDMICKSATISDYEKGVLDDKNALVFGEHCPIHVKAAGFANFMLNIPKNRKYKVKYNIIKTRDRVKFYKTTDTNMPVFGFLANSFPIEYAPPIDYNQQFEDLILKPINRVLEIISDRPPLTSELTYASSLF